MVLNDQQVTGAEDAAFTKNYGRDMMTRLTATVGPFTALGMACCATIPITRKRAWGCQALPNFLRDRLDGKKDRSIFTALALSSSEC